MFERREERGTAVESSFETIFVIGRRNTAPLLVEVPVEAVDAEVIVDEFVLELLAFVNRDTRSDISV
jgi:hypothetical protein